MPERKGWRYHLDIAGMSAEQLKLAHRLLAPTAIRCITMKPMRIQLSRKKGFQLQPTSLRLNGLPAVKVDRSTLWGNPFVVGQPSGCDFDDGGDETPMIASLSLTQCLAFYEEILRGFIDPEMHPHGHRHAERFQKHYGLSIGEAAKTYLRGKNLACWCPLPKPGEPDICHAAVLLELANA